METAGVEPAPPRCRRGALPTELHPLVCRCGRMDSNHQDPWPRGYSAQSSPLLSVRKGEGWPAGIEPAPTGITIPGASATPRPP